jgi:hypothetical protein
MQSKGKFEDIFPGIFSNKDCSEQPRSTKLEYLRRLEEDLVDLRKEVFALRKELNNDHLR